MSIISFFKLAPGMRLKEDLCNESGLKLLPKGTILTDHSLQYISKWDISRVSIEDEPDEVLSDRFAQEHNHYDAYNNQTDKVIKLMEGLQGCNKFKLDELRIIIDEIMEYKDIHSTLRVISELKNEDKYTYQHSINVSIYAMFIGKWINLEKSALKKLTYSALLHDIGKELVPKEIVQKPDKLSPAEFNIMKKHPIFGYDIIKKTKNFSTDIAMGVLQHHEKEDGSGYPLGIKSESIHLFGKIIAVADIFDAMTSVRLYKGKQSPFKTAEQLLENSFGELDPFVVTTFIKKLSEFYIGSTIVLNNGEIGEIIMNFPATPTRPLIKSNEKFIDLSKNSNLFIQEILS